jgi:hypothetical protein
VFVTPPSPYLGGAATADLSQMLTTLSADSVSALFDAIVVRHHPELAGHLSKAPWHAEDVTIDRSSVGGPALVGVEVTHERAVPPACRPPPLPRTPSPSPEQPQVDVSHLLAEEESTGRARMELAEGLGRRSMARFEQGLRNLTGRSLR